MFSVELRLTFCSVVESGAFMEIIEMHVILSNAIQYNTIMQEPVIHKNGLRNSFSDLSL